MRILGIDPGTGILGFGVIEIDAKNKAHLVDAGVIRTPVHEDTSVRLLTIYDELTSLIKELKPTVMSVEKLFFAQTRAAFKDAPRQSHIARPEIIFAIVAE